jgi:hypothetical protein
MQLLFTGSRFTLYASFPRSVTLTQLRFTLLTVTSSQWDLHPQVCAHSGRTHKVATKAWAEPSSRLCPRQTVWASARTMSKVLVFELQAYTPGTSSTRSGMP